MIAANAALNKQAEDVTILDVRALSTVTDFFIIASAATTRQIAAIAEEIDRELTRRGGDVLHVEGLKERVAAASGLSWVLIDCGDLVVHVFNPPAREFYQLERLWADAPRLAVEPA
ncbi:MAG: ribosome silencing factor [Candidatus Omnitrophica bacterium]|nr:ribosome silencing factor [Candidatus Omnitrophota bacterium]